MVYQGGPRVSEDTSFAAIKAAFAEAEHAMLEAHSGCQFSGTTATVVIALAPTHIYIAWVGDSPAFVLARDGKGVCRARSITTSHNFEVEAEAERVRAAGGLVARYNYGSGYEGPLRAFFAAGRLPQQCNSTVTAFMPGLAMSRSLGDTLCKTIGITGAAEVRSMVISKGDECIIVCTDGLTEFMPTEVIAGHLTSDQPLRNACRELAELARDRWLEEEAQNSDDISCVAVRLASSFSSS